MYLDAMASWFGDLGYGRWFIVHEEGPAGEALAERTVSALAAVPSAAVVGSAAVRHEQPLYARQIEEAQLAGADLIVLLLDPADQIAFLGQLDSLGADLAVAAFPDPVTQTRDYIAAARQGSVGAGVDYRITPGEATREGHGATELNDRVLSRWGEPLDPSAWAAYQAVKLLYQAARTAGSDKEALAAYLAGHETEFDLNKGVPLSFRSWDHQLRQPLYAIRIDHEAVWGASATKRLAVADAAGEIPHGFPGNLAVNTVLDLLGDGPSQGTCVRGGSGSLEYLGIRQEGDDGSCTFMRTRIPDLAADCVPAARSADRCGAGAASGHGAARRHGRPGGRRQPRRAAGSHFR
jgi:hypothetical protein